MKDLLKDFNDIEKNYDIKLSDTHSFIEFKNIITNLYSKINDTRVKLGFNEYSDDDTTIFLYQAYKEYLIHQHNIRKDGSKYFDSHLIGTCDILVQDLYVTGVSSMTAAFTHDDIEDAHKLNITIKQPEDLFDTFYQNQLENPNKLKQYIDETWNMVNGVSKIKEDTRKKTLEKSFVKLLENIKNYGIRSAYIKLADRLHNIYTLSGHKDSFKQKQIALETIDLYVPLAELLKVSDFKKKILNEALKYVNPKLLDDFNDLITLKSKNFLEDHEFKIKEKLKTIPNIKEDNIEFVFKDLADIWMDRNQNTEIDQLNLKTDFDIVESDKFYTIRILVKSDQDIHQIAMNICSTFKGKNIAFETTALPFSKGVLVKFFNDEFQKLEIRINTEREEIYSKRGYLAHNDNKPITGLKNAVEGVIIRGKKTGDIIKEIKEGLFPKMIFFDQNNNPIEMPKGSTILDYLIRKKHTLDELRNIDVFIAPKILGKFKSASLFEEIPSEACVYIKINENDYCTNLPGPIYNYLCQSENYGKIKEMLLSKDDSEKIDMGKDFLNKISRLYHIKSEEIIKLIRANTDFDENDSYCKSKECIYEAIAVSKINLLKLILQLPCLQKDIWKIKCVLLDKPKMLHDFTAKLGAGINITDINIKKDSENDNYTNVYMTLKLTNNMSKYDFLKTLLKLSAEEVNIEMKK